MHAGWLGVRACRLPGRSRGIGGCARAPCVFLAAAEGTAGARVRTAGCGAETTWVCYLTNWCRGGTGPRGRNPRRRRGRHRSRKPAPGANERICSYANFLDSVQTRCTTHAAALLAFVGCQDREALGCRPALGTPSAKRSVGTHVEQPACKTRCPKEHGSPRRPGR